VSQDGFGRVAYPEKIAESLKNFRVNEQAERG
jgi:hypothetical protein